MTATVTATAAVDVVCLGESMVTFAPMAPGRLADVPSFVRGIGGAESNVACALAASGHSAKWVGRVGADGFGEHLVAAIAAYGVDTAAVQRDPRRPTGIYFRTAGERATSGARPGSGDAPDRSEVVYYRTGSAASAMSRATLREDDVWSGRILHLSGITAALSADCLDLLRSLLTRGPGRPLVSFDVNYRMSLWPDGGPAGPRVLLDLARGADIVFVGEDEAEAAWGLHGDRAIRQAIPEPDVLVVKRGASGATVHARQAGAAPGSGPDAVISVPALRVDVVAPVGAGDAFAAGFLSATLRGLGPHDRLRHGHLSAAAALTVAGDLAAPPARAYADRLAALDPHAWGRLRLGPGWTAAAEQGPQDPQEVRIP
ncbi:sugar kinase [Streptomyces sp. NBC_00829]|uniref:sugar kinase n=1 Tax=Streptomyces sp. NBC_00829 TaxID=2903679 RepID=UPI00386A1C20|nr:sugar kinase [Streptomyces sp. NBC_00829]